MTSHWHESSTHPTAGCSPRALPGWPPQPQWAWGSQRSCLSVLWTSLLPDRGDRASETFLHAFLQKLPPKLPGCALTAVLCPVFPPCRYHSWLLELPISSYFASAEAWPPLPLAPPGFCHPKPCDLWASSSSPISSWASLRSGNSVVHCTRVFCCQSCQDQSCSPQQPWEDQAEDVLTKGTEAK